MAVKYFGSDEFLQSFELNVLSVFYIGKSEIIGSYFIDHYRVRGDTARYWNFEKLIAH